MEMEMARDDLIGRIGNPDHGLFDLFIGKTQGFK